MYLNSKKHINTTIKDYLNENIDNLTKVDIPPIMDDIYYHGTANIISNPKEFVCTDKIKISTQGSTSYSKSIQGLGKFYTSYIDIADSYIDYRKVDDNEYGNILQIKFVSNKPYVLKTLHDLIKDVKLFAEKSEIVGTVYSNQKFLEHLLTLGYDAITFKEGTFHKPDNKRYMKKVIIPLLCNKIECLNIYKTKSPKKGGGLFI